MKEENFPLASDAILQALIGYFDSESVDEITKLLSVSQAQVVQTDYDNWNGGTYSYCLNIESPPSKYKLISTNREEYERQILKKAQLLQRPYPNHRIDQVSLTPTLIINDGDRSRNISLENSVTKHYNLSNIRTLLTEGFTAEELRRLCYDTLEFRPVHNQLSEITGKAEIIDRLIEYTDRTLQIENLLALAKEHNLARYKKYQPYYDTTPGPTSSSEIQGEAQKVEAKKSIIWLPQVWWVPIVVALISLGALIVPLLINNKTSTSPSFTYAVRVQKEGTNQNIPNAKVTVEVAGQAPLDEITDVNGFARIAINASYIGKPGRLLIEVTGYEPYRQEIDLVEGNLPDTVPLKELP